MEQRTWAIDYALSALPADHPISQNITAEFAALQPPSSFNTNNYIQINNTGQIFTIGSFNISFDTTASINQLLDLSTNVAYADSDHTLGLFRYDTYNLTDFDAFFEQYNEDGDWHTSWIQVDFGKKYLDHTSATRIRAFPNITQLYYQNISQTQAGFLLNITFTDPMLQINYGAPSYAILNITIDSNARSINWILVWYGKVPTSQ